MKKEKSEGLEDFEVTGIHSRFSFLKKRMKKRILHLTLKKKWFDLIAAGKKKEEYRGVKPYWDGRLLRKRIDEIHFRNGYHKKSPFMRVECKGTDLEIDNLRYVIRLGKILEIKNWRGDKN